jgi:hypothetical protein
MDIAADESSYSYGFERIYSRIQLQPAFLDGLVANMGAGDLQTVIIRWLRDA